MSSSVAAESETTGQPRGRTRSIALFAGKLLVTGACFWIVARQVDVGNVLSAIKQSDPRWAALAVFVAMLQIPLLGLRWYTILAALVQLGERVTRGAVITVAAIGAFLNQVLPTVMGEGARVWLLVRLGCNWRPALSSVLIDRAIGVGLLVALSFVILLLPSGLVALGGQRELVLALYGGLLLAGVLGLLLAPLIAPSLERVRVLRWAIRLALDARHAVFGPSGWMVIGLGLLIHLLTIVIVWSLGQALGLMLPVVDAAVLFIVMVGVGLVPISVSGWGLRELAVLSLLGYHGIAAEKALLFSVCFGLTFVAGSLPGALAWLWYPSARAARLADRAP